MIHSLNPTKSTPGNLLDTDISYPVVPAWFGAASKSPKLTLMCPLANLAGYGIHGITAARVEHRTGSEAPFPSPLENVKMAIHFFQKEVLDLTLNFFLK